MARLNRVLQLLYYFGGSDNLISEDTHDVTEVICKGLTGFDGAHDLIG